MTLNQRVPLVTGPSSGIGDKCNITEVYRLVHLPHEVNALWLVWLT